ncbi:MAG: hypothetical protein MI920_18745 [Kiloniellales bacterium]|nr:hypothetical protein [Kiloniellales bacterium]
MPKNPYIGNAAAIDACNAVVDRVDAGPTAGLLRIYAGAVPADNDAALGGATLLAELVMSDPAFGNAVDNNPGARATANPITDDSAADATGVASFFRCTDSNGNSEFQGTAGEAADTPDLTLNSKNISAGAAVSVTSLTYTQPEGAQ